MSTLTTNNDRTTDAAHSVTAKYYIAGSDDIMHLPCTYVSIEDAARHAYELLSDKHTITSPPRKTSTRSMIMNNERVTLTNYVSEIKHSGHTRRVYVTITSKRR